MKKITPAPGGEFSFPGPINMHRQSSDEQKQDKTQNDERPATFQTIKL
jgi:hypothetical protein